MIDFVIKPAVTEVLVAKMKKALEKRAATTTTARGVSGSLTEMALPDLVQILWHGRKSGALRIRLGSESGEVHLVRRNGGERHVGKAARRRSLLCHAPHFGR